MGKKKLYFCIDCKKQISDYHKRCAICNYKSKERNGKISKKQIGCENNNWKGGRIVSSDGYTKVKMIGHYLSDKRGYVSEHRLIASEKYGTILNSKNVVHHLNGIRTDNRPENLVITDKKVNGEKTVITLLQKRIVELENIISKLTSNK